MKKSLPLLIILIYISVVPRFAFAQNAMSSNFKAASEASNIINTAKDTALSTTKNEIKQQARRDFKSALNTIKDQKKKAIVENIDTKIAQINTLRTQQMLNRVNQLELVLTHIATKEAELSSQRKDTSLLKVDITNATEALDTAKQALTAQSQKDYVIDITTEEKLGPSVKDTLKQFRTDLKGVFADVVMAKEKIVTAHEDELKLLTADNTTNATNAATVVKTPYLWTSKIKI
jgi:hypothetical protein